MAAAVESVEFFTLSMAATETSDSGTLTKSQTTANCIPFITKRVTDVPATHDDYPHFCVEAYFSGSTVVVARDGSTSSGMTVEVTVVEFNSAEVDVQQGQFSMADTGLSDTDSITAVTLADAFVAISFRGGATNSGDRSAVAARFTQDVTPGDQLTFERGVGSSGDAINGRYYVAEASSGAWTVETATIDMNNTDTTHSPTIGTVVEDDTMTIGSVYGTDWADNVNQVPDIQLGSPTTVTATRQSGDGTVDGTVFAVEFAGAEAIQRGRKYQTTSTATDTQSIDTVDADIAMAWTPCSMSNLNASMPGASSSDVPDGQYGLDFATTSSLQFTHSTNGGEANNYISWEVIEWDVLADGAARRIFVVS